MSESARNLYRDRTYTTETVGNITTIHFGNWAAAEPTAPAQLSLFGDAPAAPIPSEPVQEKAPTARQRELAKPDSANMATEPLQNYAQLKGLIDYYAQRGKTREVCLLTFGFCTGLRISDLLQLKVGDIVTSLSPIAFKSAIDIHEQKTGKRTVSHLDEMIITPAMQEAFIRYTQKTHPTSLNEYIFSSRQSYGTQPMSIRQMQRSLKDGFAAIVPNLRTGTHTMRKTFVAIIHTFSSQSQMQGGGLNPATVCQVALRHNSATTTLAYMGIIKSGMVSLRRAVSDFVQGKTVIKDLESHYSWELIDDD